MRYYRSRVTGVGLEPIRRRGRQDDWQSDLFRWASGILAMMICDYYTKQANAATAGAALLFDT